MSSPWTTISPSIAVTGPGGWFRLRADERISAARSVVSAPPIRLAAVADHLVEAEAGLGEPARRRQPATDGSRR